MKSTSYYNQNRDRLFDEYLTHDSNAIHNVWASKFLKHREPGLACDIGAGSGRDANWLAELGWDVIAVEPSKLRESGEQHSSSKVRWLNDSLPDLRKLRDLSRRFDLILVSAVWQHVRPKQRKRVFRILCELLSPSGLLIVSLRNGDDEHENEAREFFQVSSEELVAFAHQRAISTLGSFPGVPDLSRKHIKWDWHIFEMPDDGTGNLPLLRHIVVNDHKSSSYKLGLLRTLVKLAECAPGIVTKRTDDYVEIPFGAVGLYWIKLYLPLLLRSSLRQTSGSQGHGFAKEAFHKLVDFAPNDLSLGFRFGVDRADIVQQAIVDACRNIARMPAHHITYPGEPNRQVFECNVTAVKTRRRPIVLTRAYLGTFGTFRVPAQLWQTLSQFACWLDPAIVREWRQLIVPWQQGGINLAEDERSFEWAESVRETTVVASRANELRESGYPLSCVWSAKRIRSQSNLAIDHCFPWSRWPISDLWNLLPTRSDVNGQKSDRLPTAGVFDDSQERIIDWWDSAWIETPREEQFLIEASMSLPNLESDTPKLKEIYDATQYQRIRLKSDQQIPEWVGLRHGV